MLSCAFSGHRRIEERHSTALAPLLARAIEYAYGEGCRTFYVGGALGFDTEAAKQVLLFRIRHRDVSLRVISPCRTQSDNWSAGQRDLYEYIVSNADSVEYVAQEYTDDCMRQRNQRLVDLADALIVYVGREYSGTGQTVRMAKRAGKTVYNLYPTLERGV